MVKSIAGNYYALPLVNKVQQSGNLPLLPAGATEKVSEEAEICSREPSDELPEQVQLDRNIFLFLWRLNNTQQTDDRCDRHWKILPFVDVQQGAQNVL